MVYEMMIVQGVAASSSHLIFTLTVQCSTIRHGEGKRNRTANLTGDAFAITTRGAEIDYHKGSTHLFTHWPIHSYLVHPSHPIKPTSYGTVESAGELQQ